MTLNVAGVTRLGRRIDGIVVHCAATKPHMDIGRHEIDRWHRERGFAGIGYHYVIRRNGADEAGRPLDTVGAHVAGHNANTIGVCLVGGIDDDGEPQNNFTPAQFDSLARLLDELARLYPDAWVKGHRDFAAKACPSFDVAAWIAAGRPAAWAGHA